MTVANIPGIGVTLCISNVSCISYIIDILKNVRAK